MLFSVGHVAVAQPVVLKTSTLLDGRGHVLKNRSMVTAGAYTTLMGGFTTIQSVGAEVDGPVRDLIWRPTSSV